MIATLIIQFVVAMIATAAFAIIFIAPRSEWLTAAVIGAIGWIVYYILKDLNYSNMISCLIATFILTLMSRILSRIRKCPVTMYLLPGIFPLVPGAGIYYTSYYFIMNDPKQFWAKGLDTFQVAGAIALGIIFALALPRKLFTLFK
ncbi:MAG: threonine/serine exporter family protein [Lachnospiraceae bacterium]|nr:threonine/serine exporter family protein [Lachnospiraceae bacterium]